MNKFKLIQIRKDLESLCKETAKELSEKHKKILSDPKYLAREKKGSIQRLSSGGEIGGLAGPVDSYETFNNGYTIVKKASFWSDSLETKLWILPLVKEKNNLLMKITVENLIKGVYELGNYLKNNGLEIISSSDEVFETFMSNYEKSELSTVLKNNNITVFRNSHYFKK